MRSSQLALHNSLYVTPIQGRVKALPSCSQLLGYYRSVNLCAGDATLRMSKFYLRRQKKVTRNIVERISI